MNVGWVGTTDKDIINPQMRKAGDATAGLCSPSWHSGTKHMGYTRRSCLTLLALSGSVLLAGCGLDFAQEELLEEQKKNLEKAKRERERAGNSGSSKG